jgi:hypothetical protein
MSVGRVLGAVQIVLNNHLHAERLEGEAWALTRFNNSFYIICLLIPNYAYINFYYTLNSNTIILISKCIVFHYSTNPNLLYFLLINIIFID